MAVRYSSCLLGERPRVCFSTGSASVQRPFAARSTAAWTADDDASRAPFVFGGVCPKETSAALIPINKGSAAWKLVLITAPIDPGSFPKSIYAKALRWLAWIRRIVGEGLE